MHDHPTQGQDNADHELSNLNTLWNANVPDYSERGPQQALLNGSSTDTKGHGAAAVTGVVPNVHQVPDWKPHSLRYGPIPTILAILGLFTFYTYCYAQTRIRTYAALAVPATDVFYRFGPTLFAVVITEVILQMVSDMSAILPFRDLTRSRFGARVRTGENFTKRFWDFIPRRGWSLALACYILVPSQSGLFERSVATFSSEVMDIKQVDGTELIRAMNQSSFGAVAARTTFGSMQKVTPDLAQYRWVWRPTDEDEWFALMPFLPDNTFNDTTAEASTGGTVWAVNTKAITSDSRCTPANFTLKIARLERRESMTRMANVSLEYNDHSGCGVSGNWSLISSGSLPGVSNPLTEDNHFALWLPYSRYRGSYNLVRSYGDKNATACPGYSFKSVVIVGPVPGSAGKNIVVNQETPGWAALTCQQEAEYIDTPLRYEASGDGVNSKVIKPEKIVRRAVEGLNARILADVMEANVLRNDLVYNLTSPGYGKTFWGRNVTSLAKFNTAFGLHDSCSTSTQYQGRDLTKTCELARLCKDLWDSLFAMTVSTSAQLVPPEKWTTVTGVKQTKIEGWAISTWSYAYTAALYSFLVLYLWFDPYMHSHTSRCRRSLWRGKSYGPTALYSSPTSIAGLAFLMQRRSIRDMFKGVNWMTDAMGLRTMRRRLMEVDLSLRRDLTPNVLDIVKDDRGELPWKDISANPPGRSKDSWMRLIRDEKEKKVVQPKIADQLRTTYPREVGLKALIPVAIICGILIPIVVRYILLSDTEYFTIWKEDPRYDEDRIPSEGFRAWIQKQIFEGGPVLVLTSIGLWWSMVDGFFRRSQPFASLVKHGDAKSMRVTYMHDFPLHVTGKALSNKHYRLGVVTLLTLLSKIAVVFSAGIFSMVTSASPHGAQNALTHTWRSNSLGVPNATYFSDELLQEEALSASFSGPLWRTQRNEGSYWYPQLLSSHTQTSSYNTTALKANMTCKPTGIQSVPYLLNLSNVSDVRPSIWNITYTEGECADFTWSFTCAGLEWWRNRTSTTNNLCVMWKPYNGRICPGAPKNATNRWIVTIVNTLDGPDRPDTLAVGEPGQVSAVSCAAQYFLDDLEVTVSRSTDGRLKSDTKILSSKSIAPDHWIQSSPKANSSIDFVGITNEILRSRLNADTLRDKSVTTDVLGLMTVSELGSTARLFDDKLLVAAASNTYSTAFAALAGFNLTDQGDTLFARAADPSTSKTATVRYVYLAKLDRFPLYVGLSLLCIFFLATPLVRANRDRRTPREVRYYANVMAMIYDSEFVDVIRESGETSGFACLEGRRFGMGVIKGVSGEMGIGIDFDENVMMIGRKERKGGVGDGQGLLE